MTTKKKTTKKKTLRRPAKPKPEVHKLEDRYMRLWLRDRVGQAQEAVRLAQDRATEEVVNACVQVLKDSGVEVPVGTRVEPHFGKGEDGNVEIRFYPPVGK